MPRIIERHGSLRRAGVDHQLCGADSVTSSTSMVQRCIRARAIFIAQLYGIDLSIWQEITLVLTLMVTSKGSPAPGVSFVVLLATW
ncbi:cation:dicarboxylase symporter family transporter [Klebsiella pneumoniae]|nr:cation:dicarboxylase symporter family transporter [Klebsiella pneumoniae]